MLDLPEFDVADRDAWASLEGEFDAAFLNAGIGIGVPGRRRAAGRRDRPDRRARTSTASSTGRASARARLMPNGGSIVATASLAGLTGMPYDPMYTATKHAVVGFVRGVAPGSPRAGSG